MILNTNTVFSSPSCRCLQSCHWLTRISSDLPVSIPVIHQAELIVVEGIPRSKMGSFMCRFPISQKARLWKYLKEIGEENRRRWMTRLLTHRVVCTSHTLQNTTHVSVTERRPYSRR